MAQRSCHGLQSPVILYQTGRGISPSLLNAEETSLPMDQTSCGPIYWNWRVSLKRISALTPRSGSCRGCSQLAHRSSSSDSLTTQLSFAFYSVNQSSNSICPWNVLRVSGCESTLCCETRGPRVKTLSCLWLRESITIFSLAYSACCRQKISCLNSDLTKSLWELFIKREYFQGEFILQWQEDAIACPAKFIWKGSFAINQSIFFSYHREKSLF